MKTIANLLFLSFSIVSLSSATELEELGKVEFTGDIKQPEDISAVAVFGDGEYLVIGTDEGVQIQVLKQSGDDTYKVEQTISLVDFETEEEIDIEGIAVEGKTVYVIGSHSRKRSKVKPDKTQEKNRERLAENELEPLREGVYRLKLKSNGELDSKIKSTSLRRRIDLDPTLKVFAQIPSKENGVDLEGIAVDGNKLYAAFRGPVLRDGYVPILEFEFDKPHKAETLYVNLGGRGIRDIVRVKKGFLLIGGPVGDAPVSYELYFWDGKDGVPGTDAPGVKPLESLGQIPLPEGSKAEGITVLNEGDSDYEILIVFDSADKGAATRFRVTKDN
jgi:hypothetical protein